jgi:hypothetical protein
MSFSGVAIPIIAFCCAMLVMVAVLLAMRLLSWIAPPSTLHRNRFDELRKAYNWIEKLSHVGALVGIVGSLILLSLIKKNSFWMLGVTFGWMVIVPALLIAVLTLPRGLSAWMDFWRFYELKYDLSLRLIIAVYLFLALLGIFSTVAFLKLK